MMVVVGGGGCAAGGGDGSRGDDDDGFKLIRPGMMLPMIAMAKIKIVVMTMVSMLTGIGDTERR